ncbi:hypothetical protein QNG97_gp20 [Escherichia phage MLP1]|uniref:Baseplate protein n=1 Tax=Escherichia phage MLP1 TaxID=2875839 RepID=A0AAE8YCW2_9CAUD|nr:hypothetical protein QNG97_gp20 [Escherichia phage MLP1]UEN68354.1 hypothetical protein [Escherichia phage MLP1]
MAGKSGLDMLLMQYSDSPNLRAYIQIFLDELKLVQDAQEESVKYRYLADSFGVMVDDIAYLIGASRTIYGAAPLGYFGFYSDPSAFPAGDDNNPGVGGVLKSDGDRDSGDFVRTDTQLKDAIRARIRKIVGRCTIEELIVYVDLVLGRNLNLEIVEGFQTLHYQVHNTLSVAEKVLLAYMLPDFKPVGISITLADNGGAIDLPYVSRVYPPENQ